MFALAPTRRTSKLVRSGAVLQSVALLALGCGADESLQTSSLADMAAEAQHVDGEPAAHTPLKGLVGPVVQAERDATLDRLNSRRKADIEYAQQAAEKDPKLVASLIRHWMTTT